MPPPRRKKLTLETLLGITAVITSICALSITFYQAYLQRVQQYASVMPALDTVPVDHYEEGTYEYKILLMNNGLGPAFIRQYEYTRQGKTYPTPNAIVAAMETELGADSVWKSFNNLYPGKIIPVGQEIALLWVKDRRVARALNTAQNRIGLKIWYESVYGERWLFDANAPDPAKRITKLD
jgi:hypothetical protein